MIKPSLLLLVLFLPFNITAQKWVYNNKLYCNLITIADNVYIRTGPNVKSKIIKKLPLGTKLIWANKKTPLKQEVSWNGQIALDHWYKVYYKFISNIDKDKIAKDSVGWIFGKALKLEIINFNRLKDTTLSKLNNDWINVEWATEKQFKELPLNGTKIKKGENKDIIRNSKKWPAPFTLKFENGMSKTWKNDSDTIEECFLFAGEYSELGYYAILDINPDCNTYIAIRKSDGKEYEFHMPRFSSSGDKYDRILPIMAPDLKTILCLNGCETIGYYDTFWLKLDQEITTTLRIRQFIAEGFRFETPTSGIAEFPPVIGYNYPNADSYNYLKISLKK